MPGMNQRNLGAEKEYDRKVDALWEEKRGLIMQIVGSIEGMGKLTAAHREHMTEIEEGLRKEVADLTNKYPYTSHCLRRSPVICLRWDPWSSPHKLAI